MSTPDAPQHSDDPASYAMLARDFERTRDRMVEDLRDLADRIARSQVPAPNQEIPGFGVEATLIASALSNGLNNVGGRLSRLVESAASADTTLLVERLERALADRPTV